MNLGLLRKRVLVTGGSHGIGLAIAEAFLLEGAKVVILSRRPEVAWKDCSAIAQSSGGSNYVWAIPCDVTRREEIGVAITNIKTRWGGVDILINNVGGGGRWGREPFHHKNNATYWEQIHWKNAGVAERFTTRLLPYMIANKWGRVISIASLYGRESGGLRPWFTAAKAAMIAFSKEMSRQPLYARSNITFNTVAPGSVDIWESGEQGCHDNLPMGRIGKPEEVANLVLFLASDKAAWINGACIAIDGGEGRSF